MRQNSNTMKKVFPLLLIAMLAMAGCQRGPVEYKVADQPNEVAVNAEKFVKQTAKQSSHYSAEDWSFAVDQFVMMSKDFVQKQRYMTQSDIDRFDAARLDFMKAVDANGSEDLALQIKEAYSKICN